MDRFIKNFKTFLNKDLTSFLNKHKVPLLSLLVVVLLTCIGFIVSFAFYKSISTTPIVGGTTGKIADLEVKVMAEERDANGTGLGTYGVYPYIPQAGYRYNSEKSYCTNNSTITYKPDTYEADIKAKGHDVCYLYFDSTADLDITLEVYAQKLNIDIDENGNVTGDGTGIEGEYVKLETTALPSIGYQMHVATGADDPYKSKCQNGSEISYNVDENLFAIDASGKDKCVAYMDAMDVDIALKIFAQTKKGSTEYYETKKVPNDAFYDLNSTKSACTGSSTISIENQRIVIAATSKTNCVAYLDYSTGPILESMETTVSGQNVTINLTKSNLGTVPTTYYYSSDNGKTYVSSTESSHTFEKLAPLTSFTFKAYYVDSTGKGSAIMTNTAETSYVFNGTYEYSSAVQTHTVEVSGYYKLQVWGAQGGTYNASYAQGGRGGYSVGTIYLNVDDTLYIHTGGQGTPYNTTTYTSHGGGGTNGGGNAGYRGGGGGGGTDIRINTDSPYARVIVAGGGGGAYSYSSTYKANGGAAGGASGLDGSYYNSSYKAFVGHGATQTAGGAGGTGSSANYNGKAGTFGVGGDTGYKYNNSSYFSSGAGGGGWYGGGGSGNYSSSSRTRAVGGGGGSGWIYTESTYNAWAAANASNATNWLLGSNYYLQNATTVAGNAAFESTSGGTETGHADNGFAKVTYIGQQLP